MSPEPPVEAAAPARRPPGRPRKPAPEVLLPPRPRGRPPKIRVEGEEAIAKRPRGRPPGRRPAAPPEPEKNRKSFGKESEEFRNPDPEPAPQPKQRAPVVEMAIAPPVPQAQPDDEVQRSMIDEYGELNRLVQLFEPTFTRFENLKRAIKSWFDQAPADADATVEGEIYLLHISSREKERRIRDMQQVAEAIGVEKLLTMVSMPLGQLENELGKTRVALMVVEARTGSRRIKTIPKHPSAPPAA